MKCGLRNSPVGEAGGTEDEDEDDRGAGRRYRGLDWRLDGFDFFGTPGSIDQISRSDQAEL